MIKFYKYILSGIAFVFLIIACSKEISEDVVLFFKVEFNDTNFTGLLDIPEETNFTITKGELPINQGDYQIKYDVTEGSGTYVLNDIVIEENQFFDLPAGPQFSIGYEGTTIGLNNVTITIKDKNLNSQETFRLSYTITDTATDTAFAFDVVPSSTSTLEGGVIDLDITITETSNAEYDVKYVFLQKDEDDMDFFGGGIISVDGEPLEPDTVRALQAGEVTWQFTGSFSGPVGILFTATSSLGITIEKTIRLAVSPRPSITFMAISAREFLPRNQAVEINFELSEVLDRFSYLMTYTTSNEGTFTYNGTEYQPGDEIPVELGNFVGEYTGTQAGVHTIEFTVTNISENQTIPVVSEVSEIRVSFIIDPSFTFDVTLEEGVQLIEGRTVDLNINIDGDDSFLDYEVKYEVFDDPQLGVIGSGDVLVEGEVLDENTSRILSAGNTLWQFEGRSFGGLRLLFTATNRLGVSREVRIISGIAPGPRPILTVRSVATVAQTVNQKSPIQLELREGIGGVFMYTMTYTTSEEGTLFYKDVEYRPGEEIPVQLGIIEVDYLGTTIGSHKLEFTVMKIDDNPSASSTIDTTIVFE